MATLNIEPNMKNFDAFYEALINTHRDLSPAKSHEVNAKLVLLLANHIEIGRASCRERVCYPV